jgi:ribonuclease HII
VLLDYGELRDHRVRPLALLNDSKQVDPEGREELYRAVVSCAERVVVRVIPQGDIDRNGLHRSNLAGLRWVLGALAPPAEACLVDGFRLGPLAPPHTAVVDGDERSAAIAAASIVAKVVRDRAMRRLDALFPQYGFSSHVGYITPGHSAVVRALGPCEIHRRSFQALCYLSDEELAARALDAA